MEQNGLFCSIKLFKPHATDAFNALNNVFQIMYFYLKKKKEKQELVLFQMSFLPYPQYKNAEKLYLLDIQ